MCSAPDSIGGRMKEKKGSQGTNVSGNTTRRAPLPAASAAAARTRSSVPVSVSRSGAICTAATLIFSLPVMRASFVFARLESPGMEHEGVFVAVEQRQVQHIER